MKSLDSACLLPLLLLLGLGSGDISHTRFWKRKGAKPLSREREAGFESDPGAEPDDEEVAPDE